MPKLVQASSCCFTRYALILLLPVLLLSFFLLFWPSKMEKSCGTVASGRGGEQQKLASGKKKMEPRAHETNPKRHRFGWSYFFFKSIHPKTTSFWGSFFFLNPNTPKQRHFGVLDFLFFIKTTSFWASSNQNDAILCVLTLSPIKTPLLLGLHPKTLKKALQKHSQIWIEEGRRRRLKKVFFFIFPIFVVKKILIKVEKYS